MAETLEKTRSGHLGTITRTENSVKEILEKEPSTLTLLENSKIKCSLERCREQVSKIEELNERIINELTESDTISEEIEAERFRIDDNDLRIKTTIKALEMAEERIEQAADAAPRQPQTLTEDSQQTSTSGLNCRNSVFLHLLGNTLSGHPSQTHSTALWTAIVRLATFRNSTISSLR